MAVASPPTQYSCYYGIDTSARDELIAAKMDVEGIRKFIDADSLYYLSEEGMFAAAERIRGNFCAACFNGALPDTGSPNRERTTG